MDLRKIKTRSSIINAFIALRSKKPLEKITVKELAQLAVINKATFYQHFEDIYDLSETLEDEAMQTVLQSIPHPEYIVTNSSQGIRELHDAINTQSHLFQILFSGSRQSLLTDKMVSALKQLIYEKYPEYKDDLEKNVIMTVLIQGSFHAFNEYSEDDCQKVLEILGGISECVLEKYEKI